MSVNANTSLLQQISRQFENQSEDSVLQISRSRTPSYSFAIGAPSVATTKTSCILLKKILGEDRLKRIALRPELCLNIQQIEQNTLIVTKQVARNIFIGLAAIQKQDVEALEGSIDERIKALIPCKNLQEFELLLMGKCPKIENFVLDRPATSGKGLQGLTERVFLCMQHHFKIAQDAEKKVKMFLDVEMLTSRLADREIEQGAVVHLKDGYFYADRVFIGGGAYVAVFRDFEGKKAPKIVCRGTAMRSTATGGLQSGANDLLLEIGTMAVKAIWTDVSKYLRENSIAEVVVLGKSMGGAVAQQLAVLIEGLEGIRVKKLITFASVGAGAAVSDHFKREIVAKRDAPFKIRVVREKIDFIPYFGGPHIGEGTSATECDIEVYYLGTSDEQKGGLIGYINSVRGAHSRQTTLGPFNWHKVKESDIQNHLMGTRLEIVRKSFAYIAHFATLTLLNGSSFSSFYQDQKALQFTDFSSR